MLTLLNDIGLGGGSHQERPEVARRGVLIGQGYRPREPLVLFAVWRSLTPYWLWPPPGRLARFLPGLPTRRSLLGIAERAEHLGFPYQAMVTNKHTFTGQHGWETQHQWVIPAPGRVWLRSA